MRKIVLLLAGVCMCVFMFSIVSLFAVACVCVQGNCSAGWIHIGACQRKKFVLSKRRSDCHTCIVFRWDVFSI